MESVITRPAPAAVTFDLSHPTHTTITLAAGSTWSSGLHFHATHDEYLVVQRGAVRVRCGSKVQIVTVRPGSAPVEIAIPRGVWHEWGRAPPDSPGSDTSLDQEDVIVVERTDPADGEKSVFFWNLNGVILQQRPRWLPIGEFWGWWVTLQLFIIFAELDNVPVMLDVKEWLVRAGLEGTMRGLVGETRLEHCVKYVDESWSLLVLWLVRLIGGILGIRAVRRKFTPDEAYKRWEENRKGGKKEL
ncbi:hypothetical protein ANO14919_097710 [Xylariales sp. No.14919]|nr:hypothetical protein ANO14919_097710 [Xylariales sp. No.14919]